MTPMNEMVTVTTEQAITPSLPVDNKEAEIEETANPAETY
jgi:hypothetical protein